ncbi:UPF0323 family lipoprotein [Campylobacter gastrosuis]|uniref:UPF0323 family lipoprotein n=1 Tax=Campylobacter gastrosuis TaxID=2974576 RepID=A0ABT7HT12_9BACT|nr:UPF0323 family lipoprotein [Campylobacter gastrosuis]MDL0089524.1 UPF0323 family lipoprotein [Campylobacter gastrosuis]
MKHIKKIATYAAIGGFGAVVMAGLAGCGESTSEQSQNVAVKEGAFVVIEETAPGKYKVLEEYPSSETRVVLKDLNGVERVLSKDEIDKLIAEENAKIDNGTSNLTKSPDAQLTSGGLGLGETLLASAAGAILGSWIGSKLFGNQNFQANRQTSYKSPTAYTRSVDSFNKAKTTANSPKSTSGKSGFFGGADKGTQSTQSSGG